MEDSCNFSLSCSAAEACTVTVEQLTQHKNYLKVIKRQEKEMKDAEKKYQKKAEDLIQKYSDSFKAIKKKGSLKKKEYVDILFFFQMKNSRMFHKSKC